MGSATNNAVIKDKIKHSLDSTSGAIQFALLNKGKPLQNSLQNSHFN